MGHGCQGERFEGGGAAQFDGLSRCRFYFRREGLFPSARVPLRATGTEVSRHRVEGGDGTVLAAEGRLLSFPSSTLNILFPPKGMVDMFYLRTGSDVKRRKVNGGDATVSAAEGPAPRQKGRMRYLRK